MTICELRVKVPGYVGPERRFYEGQSQLVLDEFKHKSYDDLCRKARSWLVSGISAEFGGGREHVLVIEASE